MKKKLRKELNKLIPSNLKISSGFKDNFLDDNKIDYHISFEVIEKCKNPKWIRIINSLLDAHKNKVYKVFDWLDGCPRILDEKEHIHFIDKGYYQIATPAEIEAHKLGFHVGDEVWVTLKEEFINPHFKIESFKYLSSNPGILAVYDEDGFWTDIKEITKTPPKKPIFQINGKDMFEGDELFEINFIENWKLKRIKIDKYYEGSDPDYRTDISKWFLTKQDALNYVLEEAKRRFEGCTILRFPDLDRPKIGGFTFSTYCGNDSISNNNYVIWDECRGFNAEPIKEPKLMLGNHGVEIIKDEYNVSWSNEESKELLEDRIFIKCKGESVAKEEWFDWYNDFKEAAKLCTSFTMELGGYEVHYFNDNKVNFGCEYGIKGATLEQIEAITKALNEC